MKPLPPPQLAWQLSYWVQSQQLSLVQRSPSHNDVLFLTTTDCNLILILNCKWENFDDYHLILILICEWRNLEALHGRFQLADPQLPTTDDSTPEKYKCFSKPLKLMTVKTNNMGIQKWPFSLYSVASTAYVYFQSNVCTELFSTETK